MRHCCILRGVELDHSSTILWNLALAYLLLGNYLKGWEYYEVRFENDDFEHVTIPTSGPRLAIRCCACKGHPLWWCGQSKGSVTWSVLSISDVLDVAGIPFIFLTRSSLMSLMRDWTGLGGVFKS